ncbi:uncharacterized protein si:dkey-9i23.16 [Fundulus heteroclitus]|uniref:uncharacterized protein si:dkey-9i23.16 n=1 Tax=Fundulus heteroclitus TaxID=8078 RepID=UPI00165A90B0|nr:uncharacterized protein si:dkey-9i23.16 [Fundulus heteroclitus]
MGTRDQVLSVHQTGASPSSDMASEGKESAKEGWRHHLSTWFDIEIAAVVTILLGIFQLLLSASLIQTDQIMSRFFILPFVLGTVMITGGSFTMANERQSSNLLLRGCAFSNVLGLLGSLLGFCIYSYTLANPNNIGSCQPYNYQLHDLCPEEKLAAYTWSLNVQLLLYDAAAVVTSFLLSFCAFKALKQTNTQT